MINKVSSANVFVLQNQKNQLAVKLNGSNVNQVANNHSVLASVPFTTQRAYLSNVHFGSGSVESSDSNIKVTFLNCPDIKTLSEKYGDFLKKDIEDLKGRVGKEGQFLNWIGALQTEELSNKGIDLLQVDQLKRIDEIYNIAETVKKQGGQGKLGIIGIGGSQHTVENLLSLYGLENKISYLACIDPDGMKTFLDRLGKPEDTNIMVVSKSGTTLEPSEGYNYVEKEYIKYFANKIAKENGIGSKIKHLLGLSDKNIEAEAKEEVRKHFIGISDKSDKSSTLRKNINEKKYLSGIIHDDCGGRFGAFDDHVLVALAYCGLKKEDMKKMLEASLKAQQKFLSDDIENNLAAQKAMFNVEQINSGKPNIRNYYFADRFRGSLLWNYQLTSESLKAQCKSVDYVGPGFLHYATESDLDPANKNSCYNIVTMANDRSPKYKPYNATNTGVLKAYSKQHPVMHEEMKDFSPESIAEFVELNYLTTIYTGMLLRSSKGEAHPDVLPEVLQPYVEIYKKEVKTALKEN